MDDFGGIFSLHASLLSSQQTKGVNIKDVQSTKLSPENHGNKHNPCMKFYNIEQVDATAKSGANSDTQSLYAYKACHYIEVVTENISTGKTANCMKQSKT